MATDPLHEPNLYGEVRDLRRRLELAERRQVLTSKVFNATPLGTLHPYGFSGTSLTDFDPVFVAAGPATAFVLDFDIQFSTAFSVSPPSVIPWRVQASYFQFQPPVMVATGVAVHNQEVAQVVDLRPLLGGAFLGEILKVTVAVQWVDGDGAAPVAARLVRPMLLRVEP